MTRIFELLLRGAKQTGTFVEGLNYIYENLYMSDDLDTISKFCTWLDMEIGGAGPANIEALWASYNLPNSEESQKTISFWKEKMSMYRSHAYNERLRCS